MKKLMLVFSFALVILSLCLPVMALAEGAPATDVPAVQPAVPAAGYDWTALAGVAGATAFTLLVVQFIKAPLDKLWHIPTRVIVYLIAFATLLIAQVFTVGFTIDGLALTAVNAVIAGSAAMGAYELTFAKSDKSSDE
ncbi:MAG: hypothetical protein Q4G59_10065 [Planctomycetia bacterium]|nr:hypothetical protein [Planctomycetia bacterium]